MTFEKFKRYYFFCISIDYYLIYQKIIFFVCYFITPVFFFFGKITNHSNYMHIYFLCACVRAIRVWKLTIRWYYIYLLFILRAFRLRECACMCVCVMCMCLYNFHCGILLKQSIHSYVLLRWVRFDRTIISMAFRWNVCASEMYTDWNRNIICCVYHWLSYKWIYAMCSKALCSSTRSRKILKTKRNKKNHIGNSNFSKPLPIFIVTISYQL